MKIIQTERELRRYDEKSNGESLCDALESWELECKGSNKNQCIAFLATAPRVTCRAYCKMHNLQCTGGWDDVRDSCTRVPGYE